MILIIKMKAAITGIVLFIFFSSFKVYAGGFSNPDFGIRRLGMFTVVAKPDDGSAVFHNPAGLTLMDGTNFYHHQSWFIVGMGMRMYDSQGTLHPDHEISPSWNVGAIPFIGIISDAGTERLRLGLGIYIPNAYGASFPKNEPTRYHATQVVFLAGRSSFSLAYKISDKFRVGMSLNLIYVYLKAQRMMNALVLNDPDKRFDPPEKTTPFDATLDMDGSDWTWGVDFGLLFHPTETFRIGATFTGGSSIGLDGDVTLKYPDGKVEKARQHTDTAIPFSLRYGINWEFVPDFELGLDVFWWHYQILQEQRTVLSKPIMGLTEFRDPKNYDNSWNWCIGLLHRVTPSVEIMTGFQMDFTPIPSRTYSLDNPSTDQYGISLGSRWQVSENVRLGLAFVRNWSKLVDVQDSQSVPPSNAKGHGGSYEFGFDLSWKIK
jgi:long-chain fatty acid transport protein